MQDEGNHEKQAEQDRIAADTAEREVIEADDARRSDAAVVREARENAAAALTDDIRERDRKKREDQARAAVADAVQAAVDEYLSYLNERADGLRVEITLLSQRIDAADQRLSEIQLQLLAIRDIKDARADGDVLALAADGSLANADAESAIREVEARRGEAIDRDDPTAVMTALLEQERFLEEERAALSVERDALERDRALKQTELDALEREIDRVEANRDDPDVLRDAPRDVARSLVADPNAPPALREAAAEAQEIEVAATDAGFSFDFDDEAEETPTAASPALPAPG